MWRGVRVALAGLAAAGVLAAGCGGKGETVDGGALCAKAKARFAECGFPNVANALASSGACEEPTEADEKCATDCFLAAPCSALEALYCAQDITVAKQCSDKCEPPPFKCASGESVSDSSVCDGMEDCTDGSDEAGCPTFQCADGEKVDADAKCNGYEQCTDGSDEAGCPTFKCADGSEVPADYACDGGEDCADGSDEVGCKPGTSITAALDADCKAKGYSSGP